MSWDERFRQLEMGEKVLATDECYDNGKWTPAQGYVGKPAPDPRFTAHCVFRRLVDHPPTAEPKCERCGGLKYLIGENGDTHCPCAHHPPTPEPAESEGVIIKTIRGHNGEIIVVVKQGLATVSISLEGLIQAAVIGRTSTVEGYRTALKNLSLELLEWSDEK